MDEISRHKSIIQSYDELTTRLADIEVLTQLADEESNEQRRTEATKEIESEIKVLEKRVSDMEIRCLLSGPLDRNNAFLTLHAGAGGTESCDWTEMLFRMYRRYCEERGFSTEILDYLPGEEAGIKRITFSVTGEYAYGYMKAERGVHRLVRISPFDANRRRHTSFAGLDVVAEVEDEIEIEIKDSDLKIDTFRSSGPGGQHVNKTDSAVRITHLPTGIVVTCQAERSQHANRQKAMKLLRARLYELELDKRRKELEKFYGQKGEIAWGNQIRSYILQPYTLVKDHRTGVETGNVMAVLDGDIHMFIEAYLKKLASENKPK
jgi:peptide chain release factor 2